ncbi:hypothetical protein PNOK_0045600 [Pyrrhoderma noxium]|uniref:Zn(2)-C6 fungal-type domain-containing protein n=1 Tax=Pyrrhoderma noxium TaxID=2282107 RepID=A0A286UUY2_9AGAM|nr:hypothetical protein PNOK_0045600 [Pyrrhoderma noxium]
MDFNSEDQRHIQYLTDYPDLHLYSEVDLGSTPTPLPLRLHKCPLLYDSNPRPLPSYRVTLSQLVLHSRTLALFACFLSSFDSHHDNSEHYFIFPGDSPNSPQYPQPSSIQYGPTMDTPLNIGMANGLSCLGSLESSDLQANQPMLPPYYPHSSSHRTPSPADSNVLQFPESVVQTPLLPLPLGNSSCMAPPAVTTPQSMVSSDSAQPSRIGPSRTTKKKSCITRNKTPCGRCSSQKRKCERVSENLCKRCKDANLDECPPPVPWSQRRDYPYQEQLSTLRYTNSPPSSISEFDASSPYGNNLSPSPVPAVDPSAQYYALNNAQGFQQPGTEHSPFCYIHGQTVCTWECVALALKALPQEKFQQVMNYISLVNETVDPTWTAQHP